MLFSESVEALKLQYTDKYVAVDAARPELARFRGAVGQVKTVNMNGRALVEFIDYHLNTGWFDIDLSCLKVVDKPAPKAVVEKKAETKKPAAAPAANAAPAAGAKKLSPLEMARAQGAGGAAATAKPAGEKKSVSDVLAAARGKADAPAAPPAARSAASQPAAAPPPAEPAPPAPAADVVKADRKSMSVADMLAAARKSDSK